MGFEILYIQPPKPRPISPREIANFVFCPASLPKGLRHQMEVVRTIDPLWQPRGAKSAVHVSAEANALSAALNLTHMFDVAEAVLNARSFVSSAGMEET